MPAKSKAVCFWPTGRFQKFQRNFYARTNYRIDRSYWQFCWPWVFCGQENSGSADLSCQRKGKFAKGLRQKVYRQDAGFKSPAPYRLPRYFTSERAVQDQDCGLESREQDRTDFRKDAKALSGKKRQFQVCRRELLEEIEEKKGVGQGAPTREAVGTPTSRGASGQTPQLFADLAQW